VPHKAYIFSRAETFFEIYPLQYQLVQSARGGRGVIPRRLRRFIAFTDTSTAHVPLFSNS
jgi:hypothetical protein